MPFLLCSYVYLNLKDYMNPKRYKRYWRYRIEGIRIYPLTESGAVIPNKNYSQGGFGFEVTYPTMFHDFDSFKKTQTFMAGHFICGSQYRDVGETNNDWIESCEVPTTFAHKSYQPTPDGIYKLKIVDGEELDMTLFEKLRIELEGSRIKYSTSKGKKPLKKFLRASTVNGRKVWWTI